MLKQRIDFRLITMSRHPLFHVYSYSSKFTMTGFKCLKYGVCFSGTEWCTFCLPFIIGSTMAPRNKPDQFDLKCISVNHTLKKSSVWICRCEVYCTAGYFYYLGRPSTKPQSVEWLDFFSMQREHFKAAHFGQALNKTQH